MIRKLLLDSLCGQKRLAIIEDGVLCEMHYERAGAESLSGNIYAGRVQNVLPGMNAAFVDIGLDKNAFLYAGDIRLDVRGDKALAGSLERLSIKDMMRPGQEILAQVVKEPGGTKGPRISSHITLPGRLIVLLPTMKYIGVSRKIESDGERARLREVAAALMAKHGMGMILRTASENAGESALSEEYAELVEKWRDIEARGRVTRAPALVYSGGSLERAAVRDMADADTELVTDNPAVFDRLRTEAAVYAPGLAQNIRFHTGATPLFDVYSVDTDYEKGLRRQVWLKSGGYLVIDHTEALTVIDVNTGKFVGKGSLADTIVRTNLEAAVEVARQLRLRDLGGIIVVDFIDMERAEDQEALLEKLRGEMAKDRTPSTVVEMTRLGLVELTRKKKRLSAQHRLRRVCPACCGEGMLDEFDTIARRVTYELRRRRLSNPDQAYLVRASCGVAAALIAIGAPGGMKAYVVSENLPDARYIIEPADPAALGADVRLLSAEK